MEQYPKAATIDYDDFPPSQGGVTLLEQMLREDGPAQQSHHTEITGTHPEAIWNGIRNLALKACVVASERLQRVCHGNGSAMHDPEIWGTLSPMRRIVRRAGSLAASAAGLAVLLGTARTMGVVDGVEGAGFWSSGYPGSGGHEGIGAHALAQYHDVVTQPVNANPAVRELPYGIGSGVLLLADSSDEQSKQSLGAWDPVNRTGAVWFDVERYIKEELGYEPTDENVYQLTNHTLEQNGLTWHEAERLPVGFEYNLPTIARAREILEAAGAERIEPSLRPEPQPLPPVAPEPPTSEPSTAPTETSTSVPSQTSSGSTSGSRPRTPAGWLEQIEYGAMGVVAGSMAAIASLAFVHASASIRDRLRYGPRKTTTPADMHQNAQMVIPGLGVAGESVNRQTNGKKKRFRAKVAAMIKGMKGIRMWRHKRK